MILFISAAYPSSKASPTAEEGLLTQLVNKTHRREKRCSCENPRDKECVYFCHVGTLWINTPRWVSSDRGQAGGPGGEPA